MNLDRDICYRALRTRDRRFDGRFFVAVKSTGVYCRPVCPARTPKRANCTFVACAAAAQEATPALGAESRAAIVDRLASISGWLYPPNTPRFKRVRHAYRPVSKPYRVGVQTAAGE